MYNNCLGNTCATLNSWLSTEASRIHNWHSLWSRSSQILLDICSTIILWLHAPPSPPDTGHQSVPTIAFTLGSLVRSYLRWSRYVAFDCCLLLVWGSCFLWSPRLFDWLEDRAEFVYFYGLFVILFPLYTSCRLLIPYDSLSIVYLCCSAICFCLPFRFHCNSILSSWQYFV